jgi:hypothetical protein
VTPRRPSPLVIVEAKSPQHSGLDMARRILDSEPKANFLFLLTPSLLPAWAEEEMLKRFPPLHWPTEPRGLVRAVEIALARAK